MKYLNSLLDIFNKLKDMLTAKQKRMSFPIIIMIIIGSILEMLGVSAVLPFIEAILTPDIVWDKWYVKPFVQLFHITDTDKMTILIGMSIIAVYIIKNIYLYFSIIIQTIYRSKIQKYLSTKLLNAYMNWPYEKFININTSEVIRGIDVDIAGVFNLMDNLFRFIGEFLTAILIAVFIVVTDAFMAICIIMMAVICFTLLTVGLKSKTGYYGERKRVTYTIRGSWAYQAIMGFKEIKVTHTTGHFIEGYNDAYENQRIAEVKNEYIVNLPERVIEAMCVAILMGVICIKIGIGADITDLVPRLAVFAVAAFRLLPSISRMTRYMNGVIYNNAFLQSAYHNLQQIDSDAYENAIVDCDSVQEQKNVTFEQKLVIHNVTWRYQGSEKNVLTNLSLTINKGEAIGLMGASGAGKTTLADIILGLLRPQEGTVVMDNMDIYKNAKRWSEIIGYVPQSVFLSDDTIRRNVAFGYSDDEIDDGAIWNALAEAQMKSFVKSLPQGLDTQVGERGIKFSGGQRQRIAIARALYKNPDIIVLDEATSALDNETEKAVMEAIDALQGRKTLIIVAHRLSTIKNCDKIYEIVNGKAELRQWNEIYAPISNQANEEKTH